MNNIKHNKTQVKNSHKKQQAFKVMNKIIRWEHKFKIPSIIQGKRVKMEKMIIIVNNTVELM